MTESRYTFDATPSLNPADVRDSKLRAGFYDARTGAEALEAATGRLVHVEVLTPDGEFYVGGLSTCGALELFNGTVAA